MRVRVTQEHIDKGIRGKANACMLFLALVDAGISADSLIVTQEMVMILRDKWISKRLPDGVIRRIKQFDIGEEPVHPFEFELDL